MSYFYKFTEFLVRAFLAIAMMALGVMMLAIVSDVFMRYVFNSPITGVYDLVEICLVIAVFYSTGVVIQNMQEIVIDIIDQFVTSNKVRFLRRAASLLSAAVLVFIFISMLTPAMQAYQYGDIRLELKMPAWIVWVIALVGMSGGVLAAIANVFGHTPAASPIPSAGEDIQ